VAITKIVFLTTFIFTTRSLLGANDFVCEFLPKEEDAAAKAFWTRDRLQSARPAEMPQLTVEEHNRMHAQSRQLFRRRKRTKVASSGAARTALVEDVNDIALFPYSAVGRLSYLNTSNVSGWCTGQFVSASIVLTAAHCVREQKSGDLYEKLAFFRQYEDGNGEYFAVRRVVTHVKFLTSTGFRPFDYALLEVEGVSPDHTQLVTGVPHTDWFAVGYPENIRAGQFLQRTKGVKSGASGSLVEMTNNSMLDGASGGGWFHTDAGGTEVIGINVAYFSADPEKMSSPLFDSDIETMKKYLENACKEF